MSSSTPDWLQNDDDSPSNNDTSSPPWLDPTMEESPAPTSANTSEGSAETPAGLAPMEQEAATVQDSKPQKTWGEYFSETMKRDGRLVLIAIAILICINVPYLRWAMYPFTLFSTWIHELCHGLAAEMVGGTIQKLKLFPDGSGLAYASWTSLDGYGFFISAGYQGTAVVGFLLLLVRRTKRGPRSGCMAIAIMMVLSVLLWIRNAFGIAYGLTMGFALAAVAIWMPSQHMRNVYVLLAVTCSLNAITSVQNLFGSNHVVNGQPSTTDAHTMAAFKGGSYIMWATLWLLLSILLTIAGILFAIPGADEIADFTVCGVFQDMGCFKLCNAPGRRAVSSLFGKMTSASSNLDTASEVQPSETV